ncbi:hypothetical protein FRC07_002649 [Ceratobasidium sp. 392]|nr:hypothetical protein FRC07_002649 [Ceratobasidium sp. 392]
MTTYYNGPRVRLPSNRSLQLTDTASTSSSPHTSPPAPASVLIFPAPSSEPASPHPSNSLHSRARTSSSLAHGPLRLRHVRVDSNASSASLVVCSSVTDLSSPLSVNSPRLARSPLQSASEWEDLEAVSGPSTGSGTMASSPLTRERIVRLGSARMIPSSWRSTGSGETPSVEMWEWTTSSGSEVEQSRGLWADEETTNYEDALSQFHFPTLEESRFACAAGVGGAEAQAAVLSTSGCARPTHPSLGQRVMELPFRFLLETVLGISPATLMLLERGCHEPETIEQTGLFGAASSAGADGNVGTDEEGDVRPRVCLDVDTALGRTVRKGFEALASDGLPLPLGVSICLLASIPRRVWAGVPTMPKWRS